MERIYRFRMTTTSGGNLSIRDDDGSIWITPARVDKGRLSRADIVHVDANGAVRSAHPPSSEFPFHRAIYAARPDLRGIVHAHPVALVAFSICRRVPKTCLLPQARQVCGEAAFAPYALPGSETLGRNIAQMFGEASNCVVLENHGVVTGGDSLQNAFERFETLEFTAKTIIKASLLGEVRYLSSAEASAPSAALAPMPFTRTERIPSREKELRGILCEFVARSYQQRLMISTEGAFSARLDDDAYLITPHRMDRHSLEPGDIVLVRNGQPEDGPPPSSASARHRAIYQAHHQFQAIVHAYPVNATAFSVTGGSFDSRTIPESYLFLRDVSRAPRGLPAAEIAARTSPANPIMLLDNDGVQVCGASVLDAFDRLEVLETTAEAMINSRPLGEMTPMPPEVIAELRSAFLKEE
jgi:L-fuculose-phosphate aldolase